MTRNVMTRKMTREQIIAHIYAVTAECIARDSAVTSKNVDETTIDASINKILQQARSAVKRDYGVYEGFKSQISRLGCDYLKYEATIRQLADILAV